MPVRRHIFYSWQSDLPNSIGRSFIQSSLESALKRIGKEQSTDIEPVLDRDTSGISGTPSITDSIFEKISLCDVFVADITIVNFYVQRTLFGFTFSRRSKKRRLTPNPNVLIELGFALTHIGWDRIILIQNNAFGSPDDLPFDLRGRRIIPFVCAQGQAASGERAELSKRLEFALKSSLELLENNWKKPEKWEPRWWGYWRQASHVGYSGTLFIREVSNKGFYFHLDTINGSHVGRIQGFAQFAGPYMAQSWINNADGEAPGLIEFRRKPETPMIIETKEILSCNHWRGMGATFDGRFERRTETLFDFGYMNELDLQRLYGITGQYYVPMMDRFGGTGKQDVIDPFQAEAYFGLIRGMANYMAAIVMKGASGQLWAAYIDDNIVRYFTTEPEFKNSLPLTIEEWRSGFKNKDVVFTNDVRVIPENTW